VGPLVLDRDELTTAADMIAVIGLLKPGVSVAQAQRIWAPSQAFAAKQFPEQTAARCAVVTLTDDAVEEQHGRANYYGRRSFRCC